MKKLFVLSFFSFCFAFTSFGQTKFGVGATYLDEFGIQARAKLDVGENLGLIPNVSYYFIDGATGLSFDANLTYNVAEIGDGLPIYVLGGLDLTRVSVSGFGSASEFGINLGGGVDITENIYGELFYRTLFCDGCGGELGLNAGYYF